MKTNPLVTVLMPVYNAGDYLRISIESILAQTYKDLEFLIINDCSTDNSMEIIRSFEDPRIVVHTNAVNMGQTKSLNVGLKLAKGKYIVVNDADDLSLPQRIEKQLEFIIKHPECIVLGTSSIIINSDGLKKKIFRKPTCYSGILFYPLYDPPVIHGSVMFNKKIILDNGGYNENFIISQDYELWSSLIRKNYSISNLPDILVAIRIHESSLSIKMSETGIHESARTLYENINVMTNLSLSFQDVLNLRYFFLCPEKLTRQEFEEADQNFNNIYFNLKVRFKLNLQFIKKSIKNVIHKPYCKLSLSEIENNRLKNSRIIIFQYFKRYGFQLIPFAIFIASFFGYTVSKRILNYHEKWMEIVTRLKTKRFFA